MVMIAILFVTLLGLCEPTKLPSNLKKCDATQSDFNSCLKLAAEDALGKLKQPIPELDLPSFDPLYLTKGLIPKENNPDFSIEEDLNSMALYNLTTAKVLKFDLNLKKKTIQTVFTIEDFQMIYSNMTLIGKAYGENFNFTVHATGKYKNSKFVINSNFVEITKDNNRFMNIVDATVSWTFESLEYTSESENKEAAQHYNEMVEKHLKEVSELIRDDYDNYYASLFLSYANNVFSKVSIFEMFNI